MFLLITGMLPRNPDQKYCMWKEEGIYLLAEQGDFKLMACRGDGGNVL